ncbi:MAG TPA: hypothetical protein VGW74_09250, partial [Propionibacteriaceae bacterium]|nr:hypothetical protein [Propionibacteriaceae bacterium]
GPPRGGAVVAGNWNPNHPGAVGLEWLPTREYVGVVGPGSSPSAQQLRSTVAEAITSLYLLTGGSTSTSLPLFTLVDIMPAASVYPGANAVQSVQLPPSQDVSIGTWLTPGGGSVDLWTAIDDAVTYPPGATDYIRQSTAGTSAYMARVNDAALPANARICRLFITAVHGVQPNPTIATRQFTYRLHHTASGTNFTPPSASFQGNIYGTQVTVNLGEINPVTLRPWTRADIALFAPGGQWALRVEAVGSSDAWARLDALALQVDYLTVENRVAVATWARPAGSQPTWVQSQSLISLPSGATGWSKPSSGDFVFLWRRANAVLVAGAGPYADDVRWRGPLQDLGDESLAGEPASDAGPGNGIYYPPPPGMRSEITPVDNHGLAIAPFGASGAAALGLVLAKSGPAYSDDSAPYQFGLGQVMLATSANGPTAQRIRQTSGATVEYIGYRFIVSPPSGTSTLTVSVHRVSDGVQMGGTAVWSAADVRALPTFTRAPGWRLVEGQLSAAASLVNNVQYEIRFVVTGSSSEAWGFAAPESNGWSTASYRGITDSARQGIFVPTGRDIGAVLLLQPDPPGNTRARVIPWDVHRATGCGPGTLDQVVVSWDAVPGLGASFARYEVERLDRLGDLDVWNRVATITDPGTLSQLDVEAERNRPVKYRVRVVLTTNAFSEWAETGFVVPEHLDAKGRPAPSVIFTSNAAPELTVMLDHDPSVSVDFIDHQSDEVMRPMGADGHIVFFEPEDRGTSKRYRLTVNFQAVPHDEAGNVVGDDAIWEPLRRITRSTAVPYVCVLDGYGNRTYAHVTLGNGEREQPAHRYYCDADVIPVQMLPTAVS